MNNLDLQNAQSNLFNVVLEHPEKGGILTVFHFPSYHKTDGGWKYWKSSYSVVSHFDSNLWRDAYFRKQKLLPDDKRPTDNNAYFFDTNNECFAILCKLTWFPLCKRGGLKNHLESIRQPNRTHMDKGAMTIGMIDVMGGYWGKYMRSGESNPSVPCTMTKILDAKKLRISGHGFKRNNHYYMIVDSKRLPIKGMSRVQLEFHRAWRDLSERFKIALWVHFVPQANKRDKANALDMTADGYRFLVDDAQEAIMRNIVAQVELNG